ncbi:hypothetical protein LP419_24880 [Massilia sp. H-1]|nr:hypothetical protein LP419_24880 [Massilia sp. H-1]
MPRATVHARVVLFRPVGGSVQWDGRRITGVERKVLLPYGSLLLPQAMAAYQVPFDQEGRSLAINFAKMLAGRGDAAAGFEAEGLALIAQPAFMPKQDRSAAAAAVRDHLLPRRDQGLLRATAPRSSACGMRSGV